MALSERFDQLQLKVQLTGGGKRKFIFLNEFFTLKLSIQDLM